MDEKNVERKRNLGWRYIVIRRTHRFKGTKRTWVEHSYGIHEGYDFNEDGIPSSWTAEPVNPSGENLEELRWGLSMMMADSFKMPVYEERGDRLVKRSKML